MYLPMVHATRLVNLHHYQKEKKTIKAMKWQGLPTSTAKRHTTNFLNYFTIIILGK